MGIQTRDFDTMVNDICDRIIAANVGFTTKEPGSALRTLVESIAWEIVAQYYQIEYSYDNRSIDDAVGDDLDKCISILGVVRNDATKCTGTARFSRSTPALSDIPIPVGRVISTRADVNGDLIEFVTTEVGKSLLTGQTYVDVGIEAVVAGKVYLAAGSIAIMSVPIIGIETVTNTVIIDGGTNEESDADLRSRAKLALANVGKGTDDALIGAIRDIDGVIDVSVNDMARGVGTSDVSVVCSSIPPAQATQDAILLAISKTKASGIDVQVIYPTVVTVDVTFTMTKNADYDVNVLRNAAGNAVVGYFAKLGIGDTMVANKLLGAIIQSSDGIIDVGMTAPSANVTATTTQVIRVGVITIDGSGWTNG